VDGEEQIAERFVNPESGLTQTPTANR